MTVLEEHRNAEINMIQESSKVGRSIRSGVEWILALQSEDGGFPFSSLERRSTGAWATSQGVSALLSVDEDFLAHVEHSLQWLERTHTEYVWGPMQSGPQLIDSTVWVALAFKMAHDLSGTYQDIIHNTIGRVLMSVDEDGGWGSWKGDKSRAIVTANVLILLHEVGVLEKEDLSGHISRANEFLTKSQNADGGWGFRAGERSNSLATAYVLIALSNLAQPEPIVSRGIEWLEAERRRSYRRSLKDQFIQESVWREEGIQRWSYFVLPVVLAALVINGKSFEAFRDLRYLLSMQQSSGAWVDPDEPYLAFHTYLTVYFLAQIQKHIDIEQFDRYCNTLDQIQFEEHQSILLASKNRLQTIIIEEALKFSPEEFTLSSGKKSNYYYDLKKILMDPESISLIGKIIWEKFKFESADAIGGPESGAIPIATAVARESFESGLPLKAFFVRKTPKGYGTQKWIEGSVNRGDRVILVEDVVTTGGSLVRTIDRLREYDCKILCIVCIVDRQEGGRTKFADFGIQFESLFSHSDFGRVL